MNNLESPILKIKGVGPKLGQLLGKKGIHTLEDALYFLPRDYEDRSKISRISEANPGELHTVMGEVIRTRNVRMRRRKPSFEAVISDGTGELVLFWFNCFPGITEEITMGKAFLAYGEIRHYHGLPQIIHPEIELVRRTPKGQIMPSAHFGRVVPVYSETDGLHQKTIRRIMGEVVRTSVSQLQDPLPEELRQRLDLPDLKSSFSQAHFPSHVPDAEELTPAIRRIVFEEFFVLQLGLGLKKRQRQSVSAPRLQDDHLVEKLLSRLPFRLTEDQQIVLRQIRSDLSHEAPMCRLIQGDVGSGKTIVAACAAALAGAHGYQSVLMAPTEILANQHLLNFRKWFEPLGLRTELLVHGHAPEQRKAIERGEAHIVIGTHALFQESVKFARLGLTIVDEQHRFGVDQRNRLLKKANELKSHLLMLSATPIPRTLALTLYGDLELSVIAQKPAGRKPVTTTVVSERRRPAVYQKIREAISQRRQAYVIYPLVENSEKLELRSATEMHERLSREIFPEFRVGLLHGRMKSDEKDAVLKAFAAGKIDILVSTTVIEVGIDVPNATLMIIEHPERLGLSQLHQLRGRVGRGEHQSECLLIANKKGPRLAIMEETEDGFKIAEEDLKIRGPGEFLGTRQSGLPGFRVGHILRDSRLLETAREEAEKILERDPKLSAPENAQIRKMLESRWKTKIDRLQTG